MILLSFDIEEFDTPLEYGKSISFEEQIALSAQGTQRILKLLKDNCIKATFFCTATFAQNAPLLIKQIVEDGHELASHGLYHSSFTESHLKESKDILEELSGVTIKGYRMARMMPFREEELALAGYEYNSSLNPTFIPGRYNNLSRPANCFYEKGTLQIPASVTPTLRFPLFWLSFHNLPIWLYKLLSIRTLRKRGFLNIYFHPWEFVDISNIEKYGLPSIIRRNSDLMMISRLEKFIHFFKKKNINFGTFQEFIKEHHSVGKI